MQPQSFKRLEERSQQGNLRSLTLQPGFVDFYSNDYLGLSKELHKISFPVGGSTGSRLISGNSPDAEAVEQQLAQFYEAQAALVFNSGYDANLGIFSCIAQRNDTILYDEKIHASVRDGIRLSSARSFSFKHNDIADLKKKLKAASGDIFVAVEALYSMDGDLSPLREIAALVKEKTFFLIVDEAHSGGVYGREGRGLVNELGLKNEVFARLFTFGKAYGSHGAAVIGSARLKHYLLNFARSFIYTTALPPEQYKTIGQALSLSVNEQLRSALQERISQFRKGIQGVELLSDEKSPIQIIRRREKELRLLQAKMQEQKLAVKLILPPTVAPGAECLRISFHAFNSEMEVNQLIKAVLP